MLVGRDNEINILHNMLESNNSELIAVYGRRRVGKTFLIREVFQKNMVFEMTGYYKGNLRDQLQNFHQQLKRSSSRFEKEKVPTDWFAAFGLLGTYLNKLTSAKKKVIFIDEFPWFSSSRSKFLMAFEHFWNTYCTKRNDLIVVICGSAASFMVNKIIKNKGGLHNRLSYKLKLMPFTLNETERFLNTKNIRFTHYDILQLYMAIGGVPHYLNKINRGESVSQFIDRMCFGSHGDLVDEFNEVFTSLFSNSKFHEKIVRELSKNKKGTNRNKLLEQCKFESSGVFSNALDELIESGFVNKYTPFGGKAKDALFRLSDEYSLFYLKFIEPNKGQGSGTWVKLVQKQSYKSWSGFVFETICLKHVQQIKAELGVDKIFTIQSSWSNNEVQVDLLIDRDDGIINLCEMKFYNGIYTIDKTEYESLKNKLAQFKQNTKTKKNVFLTMLTTYDVLRNDYALELTDKSLVMSCLFK